MAVAVRPVRRPLTALPAPIDRAGLAAWPLLAALISVNVVVRTALGWLRETPNYLATIPLLRAGRSIEETGKPLVRAASDFFRPFSAIVTAPRGSSDVGTSYTSSGDGLSRFRSRRFPPSGSRRRLGLSKACARRPGRSPSARRLFYPAGIQSRSRTLSSSGSVVPELRPGSTSRAPSFCSSRSHSPPPSRHPVRLPPPVLRGPCCWSVARAATSSAFAGTASLCCCVPIASPSFSTGEGAAFY